MENAPQEVEFEHRRLKPGALPHAIGPAGLKGLLVRTRLIRAGIVLLGAAGIAFATQRAGVELGGALCLFFAAMPILWVGGWLIGFLSQARRAARKLSQTVGSTQWQHELAAATELEKVKLALVDTGLSVTRNDATLLVGWQRVRIERVGPGALAVTFAHGERHEQLALPVTAFASQDAFDAFCLAMQKHVWAAQR